MIQAQPAQLHVLPETAWIMPIQRTAPAQWQRLLAALDEQRAVVTLGAPMPAQEDQRAGRPRVSLTNSMVTIDADGHAINRYDKQQLVPFGEFIPFGFAWFVNLMDIPLGEFGRGAPTQAPLTLAGQRIAFNICYEDLFGELIGAQVRDGGATILVNASNIAWFGNTHALPQHLGISRMRAREFARPMLRATNTGMTAWIDHRGQVRGVLPPTSNACSKHRCKARRA
ncbi:MAG: apolipoprotein N-acyltransferase [Burkholderiaceae bacterium]